MRKIIIALTTIAATSGIALANDISSHAVYGDAAPASTVVAPPAIDYSTTQSTGVGTSSGDETPASALGVSSRYVYGDAS